MRDESYSSTHPPLPPTTEDHRVDWLRLLRSRRVGPTTFWRLMNEHGSAAAAIEALPDVARAAGVEKYEACPRGVAEAELAAGRRAGAWLLCRGEPGYPSDLAELPDAPPLRSFAFFASSGRRSCSGAARGGAAAGWPSQ